MYSHERSDFRNPIRVLSLLVAILFAHVLTTERGGDWLGSFASLVARMTPTQALAAVRSLIDADPDSVGMIDRCSVVSRTEANDGFGGITTSESTLASDVPCLYEERSSSTVQVSGGPLSYITHELFLIASSVTRAIKPDYKIVVAARDDMPERTFEQPVLMEDTFGPTVHLGAMLKL